jgi:uncharacterized protein
MATTAPPSPSVPVPPTDPESQRIYPLQSLPTVKIALPKRTVAAWVMDDDSKRGEGMMFLQDKDVRPDQGMIFVFPSEAPRSFWMQNTLIPLDIAYIGADGTVRSVARGKALDESPLPSDGPARYVLELKSGEATRCGVVKGVRLKLPQLPEGK